MVSEMTRILWVSTFVAYLAAVGSAQTPAPAVDRFGPQIGEVALDFSLVDQRGETRNLASLMGQNGLILVFSRSASW